MTPIELVVPAEPSYVALARLVIGAAVLQSRDLTEEQVDDFKLAVSEACTLAIANCTSGDQLFLSSLAQEASVSVTVKAPQGFANVSDSDTDAPTLAMSLIESLVDQATVECSPQYDTMKLVINTAS